MAGVFSESLAIKNLTILKIFNFPRDTYSWPPLYEVNQSNEINQIDWIKSLRSDRSNQINQINLSDLICMVCGEGNLEGESPECSNQYEVDCTAQYPPNTEVYCFTRPTLLESC